MNKIKFGFIGCGWIIQKAYLPILKVMNDVELHSVYDLDQEKAQRCACEFGIKQVCPSVDVLLDTIVDVVIIATPNYTHEPYAHKAINKNKHVICEKPTVFFTTEYIQLQEEARKRDLIFLPAYVNEFRDEIVKLNQIIESGVIGNIRRVESGWIRKSGYPNLGSWFTNKDYSGGGVLMDLGPHILDISLMLLYCKAVPKNATLSTWYIDFNKMDMQDSSAKWYGNNETGKYEINVESSVVGKVIYPNDVMLKIKLSWNAPVEHDETYFIVNGDKGKIILKTLFGFSTNRLDDTNRIQIIRNEGEENIIHFSNVMNEQMKSFKRLCEYIKKCIRKEESGSAMIENGKKVIELTEILYQNEVVKQTGLEDFLIEQGR